MTTEATDTAWKIHGQLADWPGKVDGKASFMLTLETAVLAGVLALRVQGGFLHDLNTQTSGLAYAVARALLAAGIVLAALAVAPSLNVRSKLKVTAKDNYVYFGHLRHWNPNRLPAKLAEDPLPVLSRQLVVMSKIAWRKHVLIVWSMIIAGAGALAATFAVLTN
jgi:Pycsar effector protein